MADRIDGIGHPNISKRAIWKLPDRPEEPNEGYISMYFPHPFMHLPSASEIVAPLTFKMPLARFGKLRLGGRHKSVDLSIYRRQMPHYIRDRTIREIARNIIGEPRKPKPVIKAPPKGKDAGRTEERVARAPGRIIRRAPKKGALKKAAGTTRSKTYSPLASGNANMLGASFAIRMSTAAYLRA